MNGTRVGGTSNNSAKGIKDDHLLTHTSTAIHSAHDGGTSSSSGISSGVIGVSTGVNTVGGASTRRKHIGEDDQMKI
jgi:hypothetical protein